MHRVVQFDELDAIPERTEGHPRAVFVVNNDIRVDGIPVVPFLLAGDDTSFIRPVGISKRRRRQKTDGRRVFSEGRTRIHHPPFVVPVDDIWRPYMVLEAGNSLLSPCRNLVEHALTLKGPRLPVIRFHHANTHAGAEDVILPVFVCHDGVVHHQRVGLEKARPSAALLILCVCGYAYQHKEHHKSQ